MLEVQLRSRAAPWVGGGVEPIVGPFRLDVPFSSFPFSSFPHFPFTSFLLSSLSLPSSFLLLLLRTVPISTYLNALGTYTMTHPTQGLWSSLPGSNLDKRTTE